MIFLYVIGQGYTQRAAAHHFGVAQCTISHVVASAVEAFVALHVAFVEQPDDSFIGLETITKRNCQYFHGYIGAIDGTHIAAHVPSTEKRK